MPTLSSDNNIGILIKSDADLKGINDADKGLGKLEGASGSSGNALGKLGKVGVIAAAGIAAAGAAVAAAGVMAVKSAGEYEQSRIAFDVMLGSADKARTLMTEIAQFAKTTPFELPEVVAGSKQLLAFGYAQEQIIPTMRKIGDVAAGVGVPVGQLTTIFGQVKVAGRLMGQDLLQFTNAGVPMIEALAVTMKKPQTEIKKLIEQGQVGFPQVEAALNHLTGEGSKFGGMMEKQSKSFGGIVSNIKDGFGQILRSAVGITPAGDIVAGSVFDRIKKAAEVAMPYIQKAAENAGPAMQKAMEWAGKAVEKLVSALKDLWQIVGPIIMPAIESMQKTIQEKLVPAFMRLWEKLGPQLLPALKILGTVVGVYLIGMFLAWAKSMEILAAVIGWLINVIIEIGERVAWVVGYIIGFITTLYNIWKFIWTGIYEVAKFIFQALYLAWAVVVSLIMAVVQPIAEKLAGPFQAAKNWITSAWGQLRDWFGNIAGWIGDRLSGVYNAITSPFMRAWDWIKDLPSRIANSVGNVGQALRNKIGDWDIPGPLGKVRDVIPGFAEGGFTGRGGMNDPAGIVHKGEYVIPQKYVDQNTGLPKVGVTNNRSVSIANIYLGSADAVREMFNQIDSDTLLVGKGLTARRGI